MIEVKSDLLDYQQKAFNKMIKLKVGALYMDMGTGKTRTAIELIRHRLDAGKVDHVLWFCPVKVRTNLRIDIEKHTSGFLKKTTIVGIESISMSDRIYLEVLGIVEKHRCFLVIDESNLVKNNFALRTKRSMALAEVCSYKLILNGTSVTKNETDLYSQWYILDPRILGYRSYWSFARNHIELDEYGRLKRVLNVDYLTSKIAPYSYYVSKEECLDLPKKRHLSYYFDLPDSQKEHYEEVLYEMTELVDEWCEATIYRLLTALRLISSGRKVTVGGHLEHINMYKKYQDNPRMEMLEYVMEQVQQEKVIIWCSYHFEIDAIKEFLNDRKIKFVEFHGAVTKKRQEEALRRFEADEEIQVLLGNKASGGYGLNLQFCHQAIFYSSDFDWGTNIQAEDRIHRIGQTDVCYYHYIYADAGIDRMIQKCIDRKKDVGDAIRRMLSQKNAREMLAL